MKALLFVITVLTGVLVTSCDGRPQYIAVPTAPDTLLVPSPPDTVRVPVPAPCPRHRRDR